MEEITRLDRRCPRCGSTQSQDAPEGLCPACLLGAGIETLTHAHNANGQTVLSPWSDSGANAPGQQRLATGQAFGPYRIGRLLGRGGMGEVYEAEHLESGRRVALKVLRSRLHNAEDRARFLREGQLAASISHPHTVYIYGSEEIAGMPVIAMELLPGGTLKDLVTADGPRSPAEAVSAVLDLIGGLDAAQAAGILHRDIKPSNCFCDSDGTVKVGDFGLSISTLARDARQSMAAAGFEGTPQFAAPEQLRGQPLDLRADIYAVGATLYYLLTGVPPFEAEDLRDLVQRVSSEPPPSPRLLNPSVPSGLAAIVVRCLAKAPADRPDSYAALAEALRPFSARQDAPAKPGMRFVAGLIDTIIVGLPVALSRTWRTTVVTSTGGAQTNVQIDEWAWAFAMIYFGVLEGRWGASIGKRILGLRVTASGAQPGWQQVAIRTVVYQMPGLVIALPVILIGSPIAKAWLQARPALATAAAVLPLALIAALFLTARRSNGWAGLHDLASGTRVVSRPRTAAREEAQREREPSAPAIAARTDGLRCGPFVITGDLGEAGRARLLLGFDPILRRRVWIQAVPVHTPEISAARRDTRRAGRLHWLAGRRSAEENWDAFEAPDGTPLEVLPPAPWSRVKTVLAALTAELEASTTEGTLPPLSTDRVWMREDGRVVLLDFPYPGTRRGRAQEPQTPAALLAAAAALHLNQNGEPHMLPLSAVSLLSDWSKGRAASLAEVRDRLNMAVRQPDRVPRLRRALPIVLSALPILMLAASSAIAVPALQAFATPQNMQMVGLLSLVRNDGTQTPPIDPARREAVEVYLAGRFREELRDDAFWNSLAMRGERLGLRATANDVLARHPAVSPEALARATALVSADLSVAVERYDRDIAPSLTNLWAILVAALTGISLAFAMVCATMSAAVVPSGAFFRFLGLAVVGRDGVEAGRARSVRRIVIAWSPAAAWIASLGMAPVSRLTANPGLHLWWLGVTLLVMAAGAAWTVARPGRGPHDVLAGTWVVPR